MELSEAFQSPEARVLRTIMFVDMVGSTQLKEKNPEATWINTFAFFYEKITKPILDTNGEIVKFTGDGVMAAFEEAINAINAAVKIQEAIADAVRNRTIEVYASVGIATGKMIRFQTPGPNSSWDYIGSPVDRAARLCAVATAQAILVDDETQLSAPGTKITSKFGEVKYRSAREYYGEPQTISLEGLGEPVTFFEILWSDQRYGLRRAVPPASISPVTVAEWMDGSITKWDPSKRRGFIKSPEGEEFYYDQRFAVDISGISIGARVWFLPRPGPKPDARRTATCIIVLGQELTGTLVNIVDKEPGRVYGFVRVTGPMGMERNIYSFLGNNPLGLQRGDVVKFTVGENPKGPTANELERVGDQGSSSVSR